MTWYAVAAVDDAVDATRGFLFPFRLVRWSKLAVLVLFMGGGLTFDVPTGFSPGDAPVDDVPAGPATPVESPVSTDVLIAAAITIAVAALVLMIVALALRFVFYDALRTNDVRLWAPFTDRFGQAVRLFGFQFGLVLLVVGPMVAIGAYAVDRGIGLDAVGLAGAVAIGTVAVGLLVALALVLRFTAEFVLPVMVLRDDGPVAAWRRFWPTLRDEWVQFLAYLIVHFFLAIGIGIAEAVAFFVLAGIVLALGAIAGLVVVGLLGGFEAAIASTLGIAALAVVALVVVLALVIVLVPVRILTTTYLTTYELSVLGGANESFMLLPESVVADPDVLDGEGGKNGPRGGTGSTTGSD